MTDTYTTSLLIDGWAQYLDAQIAALHYDASGAAYTGDWGVYALAMPQTPDLVVTLAPSPSGAAPARAMSQVGLQVRVRCGPDPRVGWAMADLIRGVMLGNYPRTLPNGIRVASLTYQGGGPMGRDDNDRQNWADNYQQRVHEPSAHRT